MSGGVFLIQDDGQLVEMSEEPYGSEEKLQELLARYPNLLVGGQIDPAAPRRWLLVSREVGVPGEEYGGGRWAIDHLFLDQDAIPTLVEVKRSTDSRIRRQVVGQMLDYAANAMAYWQVDALRRAFNENCEGKGLDPNQKVTEFVGGDQADPEGFWQRVRDNLRSGKVRMIFVADEIPSELQRIVEFLNRQMDPAEVLAVEIKQYAGENLRTLVPRVIGQPPPPPPPLKWDEATLIGDIAARHGQTAANVAKKLVDWGKSNSLRLQWGKAARVGSCYLTLDHQGNSNHCFAVWTWGQVGIPFKYMRAPFDDEAKRLELLGRLNTIPSIDLPADSVARLPRFPLSALSDAESLERFQNIFDWVIDQIRAS